VILLGLLRMVAVAELVGYLEQLTPARDDELGFRVELAFGIVDATDDAWERRQLAKLARFESSLREDVARCAVKGAGGELGSWQVIPRSGEQRRALCASLEDGARVALVHVRESVTHCGHLPGPERLAMYARGRCDSVESRRLSRIRWAARKEDTP